MKEKSFELIKNKTGHNKSQAIKKMQVGIHIFLNNDFVIHIIINFIINSVRLCLDFFVFTITIKI